MADITLSPEEEIILRSTLPRSPEATIASARLRVLTGLVVVLILVSAGYLVPFIMNFDPHRSTPWHILALGLTFLSVVLGLGAALTKLEERSNLGAILTNKRIWIQDGFGRTIDLPLHTVRDAAATRYISTPLLNILPAPSLSPACGPNVAASLKAKEYDSLEIIYKGGQKEEFTFLEANHELWAQKIHSLCMERRNRPLALDGAT